MFGRSIWNQFTERAKNGIFDFSVVVPITAAQVKTLRATPIVIAPAPGAGFVNELVGGLLLLKYGGSNVFTEAACNLAIKYGDGAGVIASQTVEATGFIDQNADTITNVLPKLDVIVSKVACEDKALVLHNVAGVEIAGNAANDNILRVRLMFRVHSTGF